MKKLSIILLGMAAYFWATECPAATITVNWDGSGDFTTIQAGIDAATAGDEVIVADGTYTGDGNRDLDFGGKAITVQSENGPDDCVIDCDGTEAERHRGFYFHNGEGPGSVVNGLTVINGFSYTGGGIYCDSSSPTLINCTFSGNTIRLGGGGAMYNSNSSPTLTNCIFNNNSANDSANGGGIVNYNSNPTLTNCIFSNNSAGNDGGGMHNSNSNPVLINCIFSNNSANDGGGINLRHCNATIINCEFSDNFADAHGGGIRIYDGSNLRIENCIVRNNFAYRGGGILCAANSPTVLVDCDIIENSAKSNGGGVFCSYSGMKISNCKFINNSALLGYAGGLQIHTNSVKVTNCLFVGNWAKLRGGGLSDYGSSSLISSNTFSGNSAGVEGGGMRIIDSSPTIINCILSGNEAPEGYEISTKGDSHPVVSYCDIEGGLISPFVESKSGSSVVDGGDNINDDPMFEAPSIGDYHLKVDSPCINSGDPNFITKPGMTDIDGELRVMGGQIDIGADEFFVNSPPVADAGDGQEVFACPDGMAQVKLNGSGSYDADGDTLEYFWFEGGEQIATGLDPNVQLSVGEHIIELIVNDGSEDSEPDEVVITVIEPVEADVYILPRTINRNNRLKRLMAIVRLPAGIKKGDVVRESFELYAGGLDGEPIGAILARVIGWGNMTRVFVLFDKDALMEAVPDDGEVELHVVGELTSGRYIYGSDTVRIIQPRRRPRKRLRLR